MVLKDGDSVQFGSDSLLAVQLTPVVTEHMTVEQHLSLERELLKQRIMVRCSDLIQVSVQLIGILLKCMASQHLAAPCKNLHYCRTFDVPVTHALPCI